MREMTFHNELEKVLLHPVAEIIHGVLETHHGQLVVIASGAKQSSEAVPRVLRLPAVLLRRFAPRNDLSHCPPAQRR